MTITLARKPFLDALTSVSAIVPTRSPSAALKHVLLRYGPDEASLTATDSETGMWMQVPNVTTEDEGQMLLPAGIAETLRNISEDSVRLASLTPNSEHGHHIELRWGSRSHCSLKSANPEQFPTLAMTRDATALQIPSVPLKAAIRQTSFCVDESGSRYALGGCLFETDTDALHIVATDGRRLAWSRLVCPGAKDGSRGIVPSKALRCLERTLGSDGMISVTVTDRSAQFGCANWLLYSRLLEGQFPKWREIVPKDRPTSTHIDLVTGQFASAVRQACIMCDREHPGITCDFSDASCRLWVKSTDLGDSEIKLPIAYSGTALSLDLDASFLTEMLSSLDKDTQLTLDVVDSNSAAIFSANGYTYVVMPLVKA